jgi:hypothetical protein
VNPQLAQQLVTARTAALHAETEARRQRTEARRARRAARSARLSRDLIAQAAASAAKQPSATAPVTPRPRRLLGLALGLR